MKENDIKVGHYYECSNADDQGLFYILVTRIDAKRERVYGIQYSSDGRCLGTVRSRSFENVLGEVEL